MMSITRQETLPRSYNLAEEVEEMVANVGEKKSTNSIDKTIFLGFLAGIFVSLAGIAAITASSGIDEVIRLNNPAIPKLLYASVFPCGIFFIVLFGGDLFTGNTMLLTVSFLHGRIRGQDLARNWLLVFFSNFVGCLFGAYFFAYLSDLFMEPFASSFIHKMAEKKAMLAPGVAFLRAIPANGLVCLAIFLGLVSRDMLGKMVGLWVPIFMFALSGYEHCVANMFTFSLGYLYGSQLDPGRVTLNLFLVTLGNIVGGAFLVGFSEYYLYHWHYEERSLNGQDTRKIRIGLAGIIHPHTKNSEAQLQTVVKEKILPWKWVRKRRESKPKEEKVPQKTNHTAESEIMELNA